MLARYAQAFRGASTSTLRCISTLPPKTYSSPTPNSSQHQAPSGSKAKLPPVPNYEMQDLMDARVHMGHRTKLWNPNMSPYLLGHRNGMHIINLDKTADLLRSALQAVSLMAENDCTFLWLGPKDPQKAKIIEKQAKKAGAFTIDGARWIGGTLTNPLKSNQAQRFNYRVPDCVFIIDTNRHMPALKEAKLCGIPTIGIADSDCDPRILTYPIPGNDDNAYAIYLYCSLMKHAILDGRARGLRLNRPSIAIPRHQEGRQRGRRSRHPRM